MRIMPDGNWFPILCSSSDCPTPTFIVLAKNSAGKIGGGLSEQEWIEKYKTINEVDDDIQFKFVELSSTIEV